MKKKESLLFAKLMNDTPIVIVNTKPFAITRPNIDVYRSKTIVFLVSCRQKIQKLMLMLTQNILFSFIGFKKKKKKKNPFNDYVMNYR